MAQDGTTPYAGPDTSVEGQNRRARVARALARAASGGATETMWRRHLRTADHLIEHPEDLLDALTGTGGP